MKHSDSNDRRCLRSEDGSLVFTLSRSPSGLYVERVRILGKGTRVVQSALLADVTSLQRWCDNDPLRFEFPLVFAMLKRDGSNLLDR